MKDHQPLTWSVRRRLGDRREVARISGTERLKFARQILACLFLAIMAVLTAYYCQPDNAAAAAIFELVKVGGLPLVTLVIVFYFPNRNK